MRYNTHTFANGLRVIHLQDPSPVIFCGFGVNAGSRDEAPDEEGLAHFCEHLSFKGTERHSAVQIINAIEEDMYKNDSFYTIQGVKVSKPTTKGVYIHNGKKVYIK